MISINSIRWTKKERKPLSPFCGRSTSHVRAPELCWNYSLQLHVSKKWDEIARSSLHLVLSFMDPSTWARELRAGPLSMRKQHQKLYAVAGHAAVQLRDPWCSGLAHLMLRFFTLTVWLATGVHVRVWWQRPGAARVVAGGGDTP
jgi:hypothetical protein